MFVANIWAVLVWSVLGLALFSHTSATINRHFTNWSQPCERNYECQRPDAVSCIPVRANVSFKDCITPVGEPARCQCRVRSSMGQWCNDLEDCKQNKSEGLRCINGLCSKPGRNGSSCRLYFDDGDCEGEYTCINGTCAEKSSKDGPCEAFWNCELGYTCIRDKCTAKSKPGGECESSIDCDNSICKKDTGQTIGKCDADIGSIMGSVIAFTVVIATTGILQYCAWKPRRLA